MIDQLPSLDAYNGAVQNPKTVFTDPVLQQGKVHSNGMGLPIPFSGGFALTYKLECSSQNYAVRVFHKRSDHLQDRYNHIGNALSRLNSPYFIEFAYQPKGITVTGKSFPVVKMDWVVGETLGDYLDQNYANSAKISVLRSNFQKVGTVLAASGIAHGDLQTGNVMIGPSSFKLIDYDGMYVQGMTETRSAEIGHRHFQHPGRTESTFNPNIDRFSLILIDFSLEIVEAKPALFKKYGNTGENILFTATDFRDPTTSPLFQELCNDPTYKEKTTRFAALCKTPFSAIPTVDDFNSGLWTSPITLTFKPGQLVTVPQVAQYMGAYDVCDALDFNGVLRQVGNRVELVGKIIEVKEDYARNRRPYAFINFGDWRTKIVKIAIWSSVLNTLSPRPSAAWNGKWISVTGLIDSPYVSKKYGYTHLSVTITSGNQINFIDEATAKYRLRKGGAPGSGKGANADIVAQLRGTTPNQQKIPATPQSNNQQVLAGLAKAGRRSSSQPTPTYQAPTPSPAKKSNEAAGCLGYIAIFIVVAILLHACSSH